MLTIQENNEKVNRLAGKEWEKFYEHCQNDANLNDKSIAALMGVSRQTVVNWQSGKSLPCIGTALRIRLVRSAIEEALENGTLPAKSRHKQDALVEQLLE